LPITCNTIGLYLKEFLPETFSTLLIVSVISESPGLGAELKDQGRTLQCRFSFGIFLNTYFDIIPKY